MPEISPKEILAFWLDEIGEDRWYDVDAALDRTIRDRFAPAWRDAAAGAFGLWLTYPAGMLAYIILTDQFPRNMFRASADAFATDRQAISAAKIAADRKWDLAIDEPARQFFYLPLMHSENLCDQDRAVRLIHGRMPRTGASNLLHAKAHREVIRRFGRFPFRNAALGRATPEAEAAWLADGGYGATVRTFQIAA